MVIGVGNGHGDTSSNPGRDIAFRIALINMVKRLSIEKQNLSLGKQVSSHRVSKQPQ